MGRPQDRRAENVLRGTTEAGARCNVSVSRRCGAHDGEATERTRPSTVERTVDLWQPHKAVSAEGEDGSDLSKIVLASDCKGEQRKKTDLRRHQNPRRHFRRSRLQPPVATRPKRNWPK